MTEGGLDKINSATDKLTTASHKLAEAMYKVAEHAANAEWSGSGRFNKRVTDAGAAPPKDNVVDAEFVDVEDKK